MKFMSTIWSQNLEPLRISIYIRMYIDNNVIRIVRKYFLEILIGQANPPPEMFFALFLCGHFALQTSAYAAQSLFVIGVVFSIAFKYNQFYWYSPLLNNGIGTLWVINMGLGVCAINQKWKTFLFLFVMGDSLTRGYPALSLPILLASSLLLAIESYRTLIFRTVSDNIKFFTGFSTIFTTLLINELINALSSRGNNQGIGYYGIPMYLLTFFQIISYRIRKLQESSLCTIKNPFLAFHYIMLFDEKIKDSKMRGLLFDQHCKNCLDINCPCKLNNQNKHVDPQNNINPEIIKNVNKKHTFQQETIDKPSFIEIIYKNFLTNRRDLEQWEFLCNKFIESRLCEGKLIQGITMNNRRISGVVNIFRLVQRMRIDLRIQEMLQVVGNMQENMLDFSEVFKYDQDKLYIVKQVKQITLAKIQFWREVAKPQPELSTLKIKSLQINKRINRLHSFFLTEIQTAQDDITNFTISMLYCQYLTENPNYDQYTQYILQKVRKSQHEVMISSSNIPTKYVLQTRADFAFNSPAKNNCPKMNSCKMVVTNVSTSLCQLLNKPRAEIISKNINMFVHESYKGIIDKKIDKLFFSCNTQDELDYIFFGKPHIFPITVRRSQLNMKICVKIAPNVSSGLKFYSMAELVSKDKELLIVDFKKTNKDPSIIDDRLRSGSVAAILNQIQREWFEQGKITQKSSIIKMDFHQKINAIFCSPFHQYFSRQETPPLHIIFPQTNNTIISPNSYRLHKTSQLQFGYRGIQTQSTSSSKNKLQGQRVTIAKVIQVVRQNPMKFYTMLAVVLVLMIMACVVVISLQFLLLNLPWIYPGIENNPIDNLESLFIIQRHWIRTVSFYQDVIAMVLKKVSFQDLQEVYSYQLVNFYNTEISVSYESVKQQVSRLSTISSIFEQSFQRYLGQNVQYKNLLTDTKQNLTIRMLVSNYVADLFLLTKGVSYFKTLIFDSYQFNVQPILDNFQDDLLKIYLEFINKLIRDNIIMAVFMQSIILITLIPIRLFMNKLRKRTLKLFEIVAELDVIHICEEIAKLQDFIVNFEETVQANVAVDRTIISNKDNSISNSPTAFKAYKTRESDSHLTIRKKAGGQLVIKSQCDRIEWVFYLFIILFTYFLTTIMIVKIELILDSKSSFINTYQQESALKQQALLLAHTKTYMDFDQSLAYNGVPLQIYIPQQLDKLNKDYENTTNDDSNIKNCFGKDILCLHQFSEITLSGFNQQYIRKGFDAKNGGADIHLLKDFRKGLIFGQLIIFTKYILTKSKIDNENKLALIGINIRMQVIGTYYVACWGCAIITTIVSFALVKFLKNRQIANLSVLSLFSNSMVKDNKLVESYLRKLIQETS